MSTESEKTETAGVATTESDASLNPLAADPELLGDFILESREHLTSIELQLLTLDQEPANPRRFTRFSEASTPSKGWPDFWIRMPSGMWRMKWKPFSIWLGTGNWRSRPAVIDRILESKDYLTRCMAGS